MFMCVEMPNGRLDCGVQGFPPEPAPPAEEDKDKDKVNASDKDKDKVASDKDKDTSSDKDKDDKDKAKEKKRPLPVAQKDRFRGVRIFDISDIKNPKRVAAIQTCRGSHTHTRVTDPNDKDN